ncbi:uncharacterized protein [Eurosta solidaginis]|uniref:uncharacterized protein n=1 Tax=Eurosta solidaginis TaxID=178769 RepID=UPI003531301B
MKLFIAASFALLAFVAADVSHLGYNYPAPVHHEVKSEPIAPQDNYLPPPPPQNTYIPPEPVHEAVLSEPQNTYIPPPPPPQNTYIPPAPVQEAVQSEPIAAPQNTYLPPSSSHGQDGYRYKTVRRVVYRLYENHSIPISPTFHATLLASITSFSNAEEDVLSAISSLKSSSKHHSEGFAPKLFIAASFALLAFVAADVSHLGYNYPAPVHHEVKSEPIAPQNNYIPPPPPQNTYIPPEPVHEAVLSEPQNTYIPPPPPPQNTYIPPAPVQEAVQSEPIAAPQNTYLPPSSSHGQDGYRYKTVRRVVYRRRF